jgi:hypothetical protein
MLVNVHQRSFRLYPSPTGITSDLAALPLSRMASSSTRGGTGGEQGVSRSMLRALRAVSAMPKRALQGRETIIAQTIHYSERPAT